MFFLVQDRLGLPTPKMQFRLPLHRRCLITLLRSLPPPCPTPLLLFLRRQLLLRLRVHLEFTCGGLLPVPPRLVWAHPLFSCRHLFLRRTLAPLPLLIHIPRLQCLSMLRNSPPRPQLTMCPLFSIVGLPQRVSGLRHPPHLRVNHLQPFFHCTNRTLWLLLLLL